MVNKSREKVGMELTFQKSPKEQEITSRGITSFVTFLKNGPIPASFSFIFHLFKQTLQILQQIGM